MNKSPVAAIAYAPDGRTLAAFASSNWSVHRVGTWENLATTYPQSWSVKCAAFDTNNKWLVFGADDKMIRVCDTVSWETERVLSGHEGTVWCIAACPSRPVIASGSADRTVRVWSSVDWMLCGVIDQHTGCVRSLTFNPTDGNQMITGASDRTVRFFKVSTLEPEGVLQGPFGGVRFAAFVHDSEAKSVNSNTIVCGCGDGVLGLWRAAARRC